MEDHFKILGVPRNADLETIKERYRFLAHAYHPDKFANESHKKQAEQEFQKISHSFKVLTDRKRSAFGCEDDDGSEHSNSHSPSHRHAAKNHHKDKPRRSSVHKAHGSEPSKAQAASSFWSTIHQRKSVYVCLGFVVLSLTIFVVLKNSVEAKRSLTLVEPRVNVSKELPEVEADGASSTNQSLAARPVDEVKWSDEGVLTDPDFVQATTLQSNSKQERALQSFILVTRKFPHSQLALVKVASVLLELYSADHAVTSLVQSVVDNPTSADAWLCMADVLNQKGHFEEALYSYRKSVEIEPRFEIGWNALGGILDGNGQSDEAVEAYRQALKINPHRPQNWNSVALVLQKQGKVVEAIALFQQAISEKAANANTWNNLGVALMSQGKSEEAIEAFKRSVALEPSLAKAWNNLGVGLQSAGRKDEAALAFVQAQQVTKN